MRLGSDAVSLDTAKSFRLANAKEKLESAKLLLDAGKYKDSIGRSYYAIFTSLRAEMCIRDRNLFCLQQRS